MRNWPQCFVEILHEQENFYVPWFEQFKREVRYFKTMENMVNPPAAVKETRTRSTLNTLPCIQMLKACEEYNYTMSRPHPIHEPSRYDLLMISIEAFRAS